MKIIVINGPNINMLGIREPEVYGTGTYGDLVDYIMDAFKKAEVTGEVFQSNHEGEIVDQIQESLGWADGIVINPGAYTHTSIAILDALNAVGIPAVEVHLSDTDKREDFRKHSYVSMAAVKTIKGKGFEGYKEAIDYLASEWQPSDI